MAGEKADCQAIVAAVKAGTVTYKEEHLDACLKAVSETNKQCIVKPAEREVLLAKVGICFKAFVGTVAEGASCTSSFECALPNEPNATVTCTDQKKC